MEMSLALLKDLALSTVVSMSLVGGAYFILDGQNDDIREGLGVLGSRTAVNDTVDRRVRRAVHILSLDEDRVAFEPKQINRDSGDPELGKGAVRPCTRLSARVAAGAAFRFAAPRIGGEERVDRHYRASLGSRPEAA